MQININIYICAHIHVSFITKNMVSGTSTIGLEGNDGTNLHQASSVHARDARLYARGRPGFLLKTIAARDLATFGGDIVFAM